MDFKVGDRVKYIQEGNDFIPYGATGVILKIGRRLHAVQFQSYVNGHDCDGLGRHGYCWNCFKEGLEKIDNMLRIE